MEITEIPVEGYEKVARADDAERGYCSIIAVHDTSLGPAVGGMRFWKYQDFDEALTDVLRLARGMTYKSAVARTGLGGGKCVVWGDSRTDKTDDLLQWMGRFIDSFEGKYITAEDVGVAVCDLDVVAQETQWVTGRSREVGGSGDPSPYTAWGTFLSMQASAKEAFGASDLGGRRVAIQGLGHVGYWLAKHLYEAGAKLVVTDLHENRTNRAKDEFGATVVSDESIFDQECEIFAPCALGAILNDDTIPRLQARVICGAANNQLAEPRHAKALQERKILYAPDYVVNAGGILNISAEVREQAYDDQVAKARVAGIADALTEVFKHARVKGITTAQAADEVAEAVLREARRERTRAASE